MSKKATGPQDDHDEDQADRPADMGAEYAEDDLDPRGSVESAIAYLCHESERLGFSQVAGALRHALRLLRPH